MNSKNNSSSVGGETCERNGAGGGKKLRNDIIFVGVLLGALILAGLAFFLLRGEGDSVEVTVDGERFGIYSLAEDTVVDIYTGENGAELNRLIIRNGEAFVQSATCPDGICAAHKPISREGESIVCLPHRVVITVRRAQSENAPDIVA